MKTMSIALLLTASTWVACGSGDTMENSHRNTSDTATSPSIYDPNEPSSTSGPDNASPTNVPVDTTRGANTRTGDTAIQRP